jgi:ABC-2 type transport system permease protein
MSQAIEPPIGTIYDIGYQRYEGPRLGRAHAVRTIIAHGLRTAFGIGRGARAKFVPFALVFLALAPAVVQAWIGAAIGDLVRIVSYANYFQQVEVVFLLFCAAQAPELVSMDQHHKVLPLYFSRPLRRLDYAAGKLIALFLALFAIGITGQLVLLAGRVFSTEALLDGMRAEQHAILPIVVTMFIGALLMSAIALAIASCLKSRTLASAGIVAFFLVTGAAAPLLALSLSDVFAPYAPLGNPLLALGGMAHWFFETEPLQRSALGRATIPLHMYAVSVAVFLVAALAVLFTRFRRIST